MMALLETVNKLQQSLAVRQSPKLSKRKRDKDTKGIEVILIALWYYLRKVELVD